MESMTCMPVLKALGETTRWRIVRQLLDRPLSVKEIGERLLLSQYNVSRHLRVLREAGIVTMTRDGKQVRCQVIRDFCPGNDRGKTLDFGCCVFRFEETD